MTFALFASSSLLAALVWTVALVVDGEPFASAPVLLIGLGLLLTATVATVGMVVVRGRWAHRLGFAVLALTSILAAVRDIDGMWIAGVVVTSLSLIALLSPTLTGGMRKLPATTGPPARAVLTPLILLVTPSVLGIFGNDATTWALLVVGISAPVAAFLYSRVVIGGLVGIRVVWPLLALSLSPTLGWTAGIATAVIAVAIAVMAWHPSVKASSHPPREVGSAVPIPPELAPKDVLDAAQLDEKGHRK